MDYYKIEKTKDSWVLYKNSKGLENFKLHELFNITDFKIELTKLFVTYLFKKESFKLSKEDIEEGISLNLYFVLVNFKNRSKQFKSYLKFIKNV